MLVVGLWTAGMGIPAVAAGSGGDGPAGRPARDGRVGLIVPAYFYPAGPRKADWSRLAEAARSVPMEVILNPASGPGKARDPNYTAVVGPLRMAGARVLGYVDSDYGRRPRAAVEEDLRAYRGLYEIDGYFIDQMSNRADALDYYRAIRRTIREIDPRLRVVGNPGTSTEAGYLDAADTLVAFEGTARRFAGFDPRRSMPWAAGHTPGRFAVVVHDVKTAAAARDVFSRATRAGAGWVYMTDQALPNPYLGLPRDWDDLVAAARALNQPSPPKPAP